jgi:hypothetical protein
MFFVYTMKIKDEILPRLKEFRTWIEKQTGHIIKRMRAGDELGSTAFANWFKETGIQWEPSSPYTPEQNGVIEKGMYTIVGSIRAVHKTYQIPMGLWDHTIEAIAYTWNRITTTSSCKPGTTPFEVVNKVMPNVANLRALGCRSYVHVPKTTMRHNLDDRSWKGILVGYGGNNQWKIYNPRTKPVHLSRDVRFDERASYYTPDLAAPDSIEDDADDEEMGHIWTEEDDDKMRAAQRAQDDYPTPTDTTETTDTDDTEEEDQGNQNDQDASGQDGLDQDEEELLPRDPMPPPMPPSAPPPPQAPPKRAHNKAPLPPPSDWTTRSSGRSDRPDYKDLHRRGKSGGHTHMIRVLRALSMGDSLGLNGARALGLPITDPQSYKEASRSPEWQQWQKAMEVEIASHIENGTWVLTKLPQGRHKITGRWVFKIKYGLDGSILKYKARWVVHGYKQVAGIDFTSTWAGVVKPASFRALFALAGARSLYIYQMDVVTAFLYGLLDEAIYVSQPDGFIKDPTLVCELRKALYGLRQSPRVWYGVIQEFLMSLGLTPTAADPSVFVSKDKGTYVSVYVDDILLFGPDEAYLQSIKDRLKARFRMTDLGPISHYLGMSIKRTNGRISLDQTAYLRAVLDRFGMSDCKTSPTPMNSGFLNVAMPSDESYNASNDDICWYASVIGSLVYAMTMTRPDLG